MGQCGDEAVHHRRRAAHEEAMPAMRQAAAQQVDIDVPCVLVVAALDIACVRAAVDHVQMKPGVGLGQRFKLRLEGVLVAATQAVVEMHLALRLFAQAPR